MLENSSSNKTFGGLQLSCEESRNQNFSSASTVPSDKGQVRTEIATARQGRYISHASWNATEGGSKRNVESYGSLHGAGQDHHERTLCSASRNRTTTRPAQVVFVWFVEAILYVLLGTGSELGGLWRATMAFHGRAPSAMSTCG